MSVANGLKGPGRELYVRHARLEGRSVAQLRAVEIDGQCVVEVDVWPNDAHPYNTAAAGPYVFPSSVEATRFVTHAVEAFITLGCDVQAA